MPTMPFLSMMKAVFVADPVDVAARNSGANGVDVPFIAKTAPGEVVARPKFPVDPLKTARCRLLPIKIVSITLPVLPMRRLSLTSWLSAVKFLTRKVDDVFSEAVKLDWLAEVSIIGPARLLAELF